MPETAAMRITALGSRHDAESVHKEMRDKNVLLMIPVRGDSLISDTHGKYGKLAGKKYDERPYRERNKTETIFSVMKRMLGSEIKSYNDTMKTKELLYHVLAYNRHRMCYIISCFVCDDF